MLSSLTQSPGRLQSLRNRFSLLPNTWKGVLLALISTATFTVVGVIVRILSDSMEAVSYTHLTLPTITGV